MGLLRSKEPDKVNANELVSLINEKYDEAKNDALERQWYLNIAYFVGKQWVAWDNQNKKLFEPPKEWWEVRLVSNQIRPTIRTELAKITKSKPIIEVIPATNEDEDITTAKACTKLIDYLWRKLDMREKIFELGLWKLVCGTVYLKTFWNPQDGDIIDEEGTRLGDVNVEVVSPFELKRDPTAKKWSHVRWCIEEKLRHVDYVEEKYGIKVDPEDGLLSTNIFDSMLSNLNGVNGGIESKPVKDSVRIREYWEIPSKKYPNGRHITIANGKLLQYEDNPYGRLPYECFVHIRVPGRVEGASIIEDLIPLQREYNMARSQRIMNRNLTFNQRLLVPQGCLVTEPTNEPGEIIEYNPTRGIPTWQSPPTEPGYVTEDMDRTLRDIENVSGIHEVSRGTAPPGVKSGVAIAYLQEQDDTKLGPTIHSLENGLEKWAVFVLDIVEKWYTEPRLVKVLGKNNQIEVIDFKGSDIKGNRDVIVVAGSALPQSKAARQEFILNLVDRKILTDPQIILKLLEFGNIEEIFEEIAIDINQAQSENKRWLMGDVNNFPIVRDFYNHQIHISEHNKFRKSDDYEQLPLEIQQLIDLHVKEHQVYLQPPDFMPEFQDMGGGGLLEGNDAGEMGPGQGGSYAGNV